MIPQQENTDLEKGFQRMILAIREWGKGWCEMSCVQVVRWCVIVSVCACHLSVCGCVHVSTWPWSEPWQWHREVYGAEGGGILGMLKEQKCRNENSVTEVRSQWLWKGGADGWLCKLCKQCERVLKTGSGREGETIAIGCPFSWLTVSPAKQEDGGCVRVTRRDLMGLITILSEIYLKLFRERHYIPREPSLILIVYLLIKWQSKTMLMGKITSSPLSTSIPHVDRPRTYLKLHVKALMWSLTIS